MSILNNLKGLQTTVAAPAKVKMTPEQVKQCKEALVRDNRGYNVQPNEWDVNMPYRVALNYSGNWANFGRFQSADVAAAVGAIVSLGYFGDNARVGEFDQDTVEASQEFQDWIADDRNKDIISRSNGELPCIHGNSATDKGPNPF